MFVFASYGVQLFGGKLARCNDPTVKERVSLCIKMVSCNGKSQLQVTIVSYICRSHCKSQIVSHNCKS